MNSAMRDRAANEILGSFSLKTASEIRDSRNPYRSRVATWLYANNGAMLVISVGATLPYFSDVKYLNGGILIMKFDGQHHKLTAPTIALNGIIEFPNSMAIAGPKKYMKAISNLINASRSEA